MLPEPHEPHAAHAVSTLLAPGMVMVDAGAAWGYYTLLAARRVGPEGCVLAVEPDPRMFHLLQRNLELHHLPQVRPLPLALGRTSGTIPIEAAVDGRGAAIARSVPLADVNRPGVFTVPCARLDDVVGQQGLEAVDLVRIDVEGAEDAVLDGMGEGLAGRWYRRVLLTMHAPLLAERALVPGDLCATLARAGYEGWAFGAATPGSAGLHRTDIPPAEGPVVRMLWTLPDAAPR